MELKRSWPWCLLPALLALVVYAPVVGFDFINYDDNAYFYENPHVTGGLTAENARWAFEIHGPSMWIPLTWLSHQAMVSLFGAEAGPHHALNLLLHAANAALLALWLGRATRSPGLGLLVATVFAVHPIHAESVAWVTERKDVLSLFFCLLALLAHERRGRAGGGWSWGLMLLFHTLAVAAKPLAVTLPCAMLLVDLWPLRRRITGVVVLEKLPLLAVSAVGSWLTVLCQNTMGAIASGAEFPLSMRLANAVVSYTTYVRRLFLPDDLMAHYPYPDAVPASVWVPAVLVLVAITVLAWRLRRVAPVVGIGWLWFLGTLVPMIGLVQAGGSAMANRYAYFTFIGLYLAIFGGLRALVKVRPASRAAVSGGIAAALVLLTWLGRGQVRVWRDSESVFRHALSVSEANHLAHNNLGLALDEKGRSDEARAHYLAALAFTPGYTQAANNLGILEAKSGRPRQAEQWLEQVVARTPGHAIAWHNLGKVRAELGEVERAREAFRRSIELEPDFAMPRYDLAGLEIREGRYDEAERVLVELLDRFPAHADGWVNRGFVAARKGRTDAAVAAYRRAAELGSPQATTNLASLMADLGRWEEAGEVAFSSERPGALLAVAGRLREAARLREARQWLERAVGRWPESGDVRNDLGVVLGMMGEREVAEYCFMEALRLRPDHPTATANLHQVRDQSRTPTTPSRDAER